MPSLKPSPSPPTRWASTASSSSSTRPRSRRRSARCCSRWATPRWRATARGRSMRYRQGGMNLIVNARRVARRPRCLSAMALRVRDAGFAYRHCVDLGAWEMPPTLPRWSSTSPAFTASATASSTSSTGTATSRSTTSTSSVPGARIPRRPAWPDCTGSASCRRSGPTGRATGSTSTRASSASPCSRTARISACCPTGTLLESPCRTFYLQLIEPPSRTDGRPWQEGLVRVGLGAPDVPAAVWTLTERGVVFVDHGAVQPSDRARSRRST